MELWTYIHWTPSLHSRWLISSFCSLNPMVSWLHTLPNLGGQADTPLFLLRTISFAKHLDNAQFSGHPSPSIRRLHRWAMAPSCAARCQQWCWTSVCGGCWAKLRTSLRGRPGWEGDKGPISCSAASIPMVDLNTFVASNSSSLLKSTHIFFEHHHFSCQFRPPYIFFFRRPGLELSKVCLGVRPAHDLGLGATAFPGLFAHGAGHLQGMAVSQLLGSRRIPRSVAFRVRFQVALLAFMVYPDHEQQGLLATGYGCSCWEITLNYSLWDYCGIIRYYFFTFCSCGIVRY